MSSTLIALPLSNGESFLLRTPDSTGREWTILVDSGKKYGAKTRELAKKLSEISPSVQHIDVAICTHSDADHSQGFWHFADDWYGMGRTIGEYWLPGRWANAFPKILMDPTGFAAKLAEGAFDASEEISDLAKSMEFGSREGMYERASKLLSEDEAGSAVFAIEEHAGSDLSAFGLNADEIFSIRLGLEETDDTVDPLETAIHQLENSAPWTLHPFGLWESSKGLSAQSEGRAAFLEVAETAKAIDKIARSAIAHDIGVRWFDFGEYMKTDTPRGGISGLLEPCCAVEVLPDRSKSMALSNIALFHSLRLTRQNVESLVFYRPETDTDPGVLFLGDSRLAHGINRPGKNFPRPFEKPERKLLVTAPHHGSRNNDHAFSVLDVWLGSADQFFVRNGGQSGQKLDRFLHYDDRRCAQCFQCHGTDWSQWVAVMTDGNSWKWPPNSEACGKPKQ